LLGYDQAAQLAKEAIERDVSVRELVSDKGILSTEELDRVLDLRAMTEIGVPGRPAPPSPD
jgi:aspartate ammonia-lyase